MDLRSNLVDVSGMELLKTVQLYDLQSQFRDRRVVPPDINSISFEYVASYNWLLPADVARRQGRTTHPIIVIPGAPSVFVQWTGGQMEADKEVSFADENRYFTETYPMEPLFRAVLLEGHDPLALQTLDIATDRHNLRCLYEFCRYRSTSQKSLPPRPFQIKIERIGSRLVVFEQCTEIEYPARRTPIYGKRFEKLCTRPWSELTKGSHYSIIKYELGDGLWCLVRCNADSAVWEEGDDSSRVSNPNVGPKPFPDSKLRYIQHGYRKYDFKYVELTTRADDSIYPDYVWDQLYFGRVREVYIGWHKDGYCLYPQRLSVEEVQKRMKDKQIPPYALTALRILLRQLVDFVRQRPAGERYLLNYDLKTPDIIRLYKRTDTAETAPEAGILPPKLKVLLEEGSE